MKVLIHFLNRETRDVKVTKAQQHDHGANKPCTNSARPRRCYYANNSLADTQLSFGFRAEKSEKMKFSWWCVLAYVSLHYSFTQPLLSIYSLVLSTYCFFYCLSSVIIIMWSIFMTLTTLLRTLLLFTS